MKINKKVKKIIFQIILVYLCVLAGLYFLQRKMIFFPDQTTPDISLYSNFDEIPVKTTDGLTITGWHHLADQGKPTLVFLHGNAGHHGHRIHNVESYIEAGFGVLLAGYRGYGGNEGAPSEAGVYNDARAYISQLIKDGINEKNIILYGQSIGSGVAVQMATEFKNVKALILEAPYTSLPDVAAKTYFFIPVHLLMKDKFDSLSKIKSVSAPLLIMHGLDDKVIPPAFGQTLYTEANRPKELFQLGNHGHNDLPFEALSSKVIEFTH